MYKFTKSTAGVFTIHQSEVIAGQSHKKMFSNSGITTQTQNTANLYIKGEFVVSGGLPDNVVFNEGMCSLDKIIEFDSESVVTETAVKDGLRYCVAIEGDKNKWCREVKKTDFTATQGALLIVMSGFVECDGKTFYAGDIVQVTSSNSYIEVTGSVFVASEVSVE